MTTSAAASSAQEFKPDAFSAKRLDAEDPLRVFKTRFHFPLHPGGRALYLCGNSLGLQPKSVKQAINQELEDWAALGVRGHFEAKSPWIPYPDAFRESGARLVGARPGETVYMNSMTVNLHLMLTSFYRPEGKRARILIEEDAFPSVTNALRSHLLSRGLDADAAILTLRPREGETLLREEDIEACLRRRGGEIALTLLGAVDYRTGQALDVRRLTAAAKAQGCLAGWDLAHAAGNIPLSLHLWDVDFAVWCSYKYLNAGPGSSAGCFVHERHGLDANIPRLAGWWGKDTGKRFSAGISPGHKTTEGAEGWRLSSPSILALAPVKASLEIFEEAGIEKLREKSVRLSGYLLYLLKHFAKRRWRVLTPEEPERRGAQVSIRLDKPPEGLFAALEEQGVICDFRSAGDGHILRAAPVPLYNSFEDVWRFVEILDGAA